MPTRNVNLTDELEGYIQAKVESGRFQNASDVVRTALRALEREDREFEAKLAALRNAIDEGDTSGVLNHNPFERIRAAIEITKNPD
jgi:antitoxin ParD1/3/4